MKAAVITLLAFIFAVTVVMPVTVMWFGYYP